MESSFRCYANMIVQMALLAFTLETALASAEPGKGEAPVPLRVSVECVGGYPIRPLPTSVKWHGREYDVESGIAALLDLIRHPEKSDGHWNSAVALTYLSMLDRHLKDRPCLDELATLYDGPGEVNKGGILLCFKGSDDPRGIPVFIRTLDREQDMKLRLSAAAGLAQWNVRRGVAELVDLLESKEILPQPARMVYVRDNARDLFRTKNRLKGWGFPDEEIRKSIGTQVGFDPEESRKRSEFGDEETRKAVETRARVVREEFVALYISEIKKWFAENEHRFPDWKPGDPLPEASSGKNNKSSNE